MQHIKLTLLSIQLATTTSQDQVSPNCHIFIKETSILFFRKSFQYHNVLHVETMLLKIN